MRNIIAIVSTLIVLGLMAYTFTTGRAFQGGEAGKIIEDLRFMDDSSKVNKKLDTQEEDKLKVLREKAGNESNFKVSNDYKVKCSSCHAANGSGMQNGKKLMGTRLIGQSEEKLLKALVDFKSGRRENLIMKGLLMNLNDNELKMFAKEISQFKSKQDASAK